jgi:predicted dithiol-disulfide oxidoreductase (DUF899 family)
MSISTLAPKVVSREEWLAARKALLATEKDDPRARRPARRRLPWVKVEERYVSTKDPQGQCSLQNLFQGQPCGWLRLAGARDLKDQA